MLPFPVSVNHMRTVKGRQISHSEKYKEWKDNAYEALLQQRPWVKFDKEVRCKIHLRRPDRRRRDLSNFYKGIYDFLEQYGVFSDDTIIEKEEAAWSYDPDLCGVMIEISEIPEFELMEKRKFFGEKS